MSPREIDALVAEHCMGSPKPAEAPAHRGYLGAPHGVWEAGISSVPVGSMDWFPPFYSTDPAASKQLKDKLWADGWRWLVQALSNDRYVARFWRIRLEDEGNDETSTIVEGEAYDDAELMAVALAALSAKGHPIKEEQP